MLRCFDVNMSCIFFMASIACPFLVLKSSVVSNLLPRSLHFFHLCSTSGGGFVAVSQSSSDQRYPPLFEYSS